MGNTGSSVSAAVVSSIVKKTSVLRQNGTRIALVVQGVNEDLPVLTVHPDELLPSASLSKLFVAYGVLGLLGPSYTFKTKVFFHPSQLRQGVLQGPLVVKGYGDPFLVSERLWLFAQHIFGRGLREIKGGLLVDQSYFVDSPEFHLNRDAMGATSFSPSYLSPISSTALNFNVVTFGIFDHLKKEEGEFQVAVVPDSSSSEVHHRLTPTKQGTHLRISQEMVHDRFRYLITGKALLGNTAYLYQAVDNPTHYFGDRFLHILNQVGVKISGPVQERKEGVALEDKPGFQVIIHESLPLSELVYLMNHYSNNFMADSLVFAVGRQEKSASYVLGRKRLVQWHHQQGIEISEEELQVGSGLNPTNRARASQLVKLLKTVWDNPELGVDFFASLPVSGRKGTLNKGRFPVIVRAKTGSMDHVYNLAGLLYAKKKGPPYFFALMLHHPKKDSADLKLCAEEMIYALSEQL